MIDAGDRRCSSRAARCSSATCAACATQPLFAAADRAGPGAGVDDAGRAGGAASSTASASDEELVVDPGAVRTRSRRSAPDVADVDVRLKPGRAENEMTRFRYDVVLQQGGRRAGAGAPTCARSPLERLLGRRRPRRARRRAGGAAGHRAAQRPARARGRARRGCSPSGDDGRRVADVRTALAAVPAGDHPDDLDAIDDRYDVAATWSPAGLDRFDLVLRLATARRRGSRRRPSTPTWPWSAYTNQPARRDAKTLGAGAARPPARRRCPTTWCRRAFVLLDALPRTPNGKIDRNALPAPDRGRVEGAEALVAAAERPRGDDRRRSGRTCSRSTPSAWRPNLFDLGANSLMMVRASSRLSEALGRKVVARRDVRLPDGALAGRPPRRRRWRRGGAPSPRARTAPRPGARRCAAARAPGPAAAGEGRPRRRRRGWRSRSAARRAAATTPAAADRHDDRADRARPRWRAVRRAAARQGRLGRHRPPPPAT